MKKLSLFICALGLVFVGTGCSSTRAITPVQGHVNIKDLETVKKAITIGGAERGWTSKPTGNNTVELLLNNRQHMVKVEVAYTTTDYTIIYKDSANMNYDASSNTIHPKYEKWVAKLRQSINSTLAKLQ